jgi:sec-independent protein translocase protein TatB
MFDISWGELLLIGAVALIVIGPKELPSVLRTVGQWVTKLRRMANEFQGQFQEAIREAEMADLKKEVDDLAAQAKSYANFDPIGDVQKDIENTLADKPAEATTADKPTETPAADKSAAAAAATTAMSHTPADVEAPVESAMRAAAELNASAAADAAPAAPVAPAVEVAALSEVAPVPPPSAPVAEPAPAPAAVPEDDWPVPASFKEPLGKRSAGSA